MVGEKNHLLLLVLDPQHDTAIPRLVAAGLGDRAQTNHLIGANVAVFRRGPLLQHFVFQVAFKACDKENTRPLEQRGAQISEGTGPSQQGRAPAWLGTGSDGGDAV